MAMADQEYVFVGIFRAAGFDHAGNGFCRRNAVAAQIFPAPFHRNELGRMTVREGRALQAVAKR